MATIITNRATISYNNGTVSLTAVSNTTSATVLEALSIRKLALSDTYKTGDDLTYSILLENSSDSDASDIIVTDDLGSYDFNGNTVTPLDYGGSAQLFINGSFVSDITPVINANSIVFTVPSIPANSNAQILYNVTVNEFANSSAGSEITNTASVDFECDCICNQGSSDSETVQAEEYAELSIVKSVCPNPIICGERVTYVIDIYNYGNIAAADVVLTDTFVPTLEDIAVTVDGVLIPESDYSYIDGTLTLPAEDSEYSLIVPAATFSQNAESGIYEVTPGHLQIIITGV